MWNMSPGTYPSCQFPSPPAQNCDANKFKLCFKFGNVSICNGCRNYFCETDKILVQHPEFRNFTSPRTGLQQSKYGNAYYHINCVALKYPHFQPSLVFIPDILKRKLNYSDEQFLVMINNSYTNSSKLPCDDHYLPLWQRMYYY